MTKVDTDRTEGTAPAVSPALLLRDGMLRKHQKLFCVSRHRLTHMLLEAPVDLLTAPATREADTDLLALTDGPFWEKLLDTRSQIPSAFCDKHDRVCLAQSPENARSKDDRVVADDLLAFLQHHDH